MSNIVNNPKMTEQKHLDVAAAFEHRATWMYLLLDELKKAGGDVEKIGRAAIRRCGVFTSNNYLQAMGGKDDLGEFKNIFGTPGSNGQAIFNMTIEENTDDKYYIHFHYCPLVNAWQKQGASDEECKLLCDIAMEGDRGINDVFKTFKFSLGKTIAQGHSCCEIFFDKV